MGPVIHRPAETVLRQWRTGILNGFLIIAAVIAAVMTVATALDARSSPELSRAVVVYLVLAAVLAVLAIFRQIAYPIRAWGLLIVCELAGLAAMATFGLGSAGRLYLLAVPILALDSDRRAPGHDHVRDQRNHPRVIRRHGRDRCAEPVPGAGSKLPSCGRLARRVLRYPWPSDRRNGAAPPVVPLPAAHD